jgi:hypothetical protein
VRRAEVVQGEAAETAAPSPLPSGAGLTSADAVLSLQHSIGNAAVTRLAKKAGSPPRTPPTPRLEPDDRVAASLRQAVVARTNAARRMVQRDIVPVPPYQADPPWSQVGPKNPFPTCVPYLGLGDVSPEGAWTWRLLYSVVDAPKVLGDRCNCATVRTAYDLFMRAQVPKSMRKFSLADDGNCVSEQLAKAKTHVDLEAAVLAKWQAIEKAQIPLILSGGKREAEIDLIEAAEFGRIVTPDPSRSLTQKNVDNEITYTENNLAGGLLFGGGSSTNEKTDDSEFGPDTRRLSGTIKLRRFDDGANPAWMSVEQTVTFKYSIHDALDFCPGNTLQKSGFSVDTLKYNEVITDFSRLEASGMARDVSFDVDYHRTTTLTSEIPLSPAP